MKAVGLATCSLFLLAGCVAAGTISVQPTSVQATPGAPFAIGVNVSGVSDLFAFQFDIGFDSPMLAVLSVSEGNLFNTSGVAFNPGIVDNFGGVIRFISDSLSGAGPGISADGSLAEIVFQAVGPGASALTLENILLLNSALDDIAVVPSPASIVVSGVPEPSSLLLSGVALGYLLRLFCRRTRR